VSEVTPTPTEWEGGTGLPALARNVSTRYLVIGVEACLGVLLLPFNLAQLGAETYGLWMVAASITAYFSILDLGYGGALVKFVAQYRARQDARAINEILSTLFFLFTGVGVLAWLVAAGVAYHLDSFFDLSPAQAATGRAVLLIVSANVAAGFAFSVFGGVINGFQRYDLNNLVGLASSVVVALVNVAVLAAGYGLITLVAATTAVRLASYVVYRHNAYRVFPALSVSPSLARSARLREVTGFSVFMLLLDWASKVNYSVDAIVIGAVLGTAQVAVWTVAQRLAEVSQRLTNQLNDVLFPAVVDSDTGNRPDRLQLILVQGTRLSLAAVLPVAFTLGLLARPVVTGWVGPGFDGAVAVLQVLAVVVAIRVGTATANTVLKGAGKHRLLAVSNVLTAAGNLLLSLLLVRRFGLAGVAYGTLVPIASSSLLVLFPAACHRVGLGLGTALRVAVWPAAWPGLVVALGLAAARPHVPPSLPLVALCAAAAGLAYLALFLLWGLPPQDRRLYLSKAAVLLARVRRVEATT